MSTDKTKPVAGNATPNTGGSTAGNSTSQPTTPNRTTTEVNKSLTGRTDDTTDQGIDEKNPDA